jgi:flagellar hook-associated protein 1 FlgK
VLTSQVDGSREQLSGVNLDEEMVTMSSAQRAYEAAARVMTTVDSVLDTLINRTGLVR